MNITTKNLDPVSRVAARGDELRDDESTHPAEPAPLGPTDVFERRTPEPPNQILEVLNLSELPRRLREMSSRGRQSRPQAGTEALARSAFNPLRALAASPASPSLNLVA